jgi:hypothetical protein
MKFDSPPSLPLPPRLVSFVLRDFDVDWRFRRQLKPARKKRKAL